MNANNIDSALPTQEANSSIVDEFLHLCEASDADRTNGLSTKRATNLPDLSQKDAEFAPRIGIVIPIYNVAPYLRECLDSVLNQTYKNFHAVLVNDGSTDSSKEIALEYVAKDSRFALIDKANGGLSSARNAGIKYFSQSAESSLACHSKSFSCHSERSEESKKKNNRDSSVALLPQNDKVGDFAESSLDSANIYAHKNTILNPQIDYIIFLDSDDFWDENLLQTCVDSANSQNLDIIWFNYQAFYDNNNRGGGVAPLLAKIIPTTILTQKIA